MGGQNLACYVINISVVVDVVMKTLMQVQTALNHTPIPPSSVSLLLTLVPHFPPKFCPPLPPSQILVADAERYHCSPYKHNIMRPHLLSVDFTLMWEQKV